VKRRVKWVTIVVAQVGEDVKTLIGFGKEYHALGSLLINCETGEIMRVIYSQPIKVVE